SFVRRCSTRPIPSLGSSTWTRTERIRGAVEELKVEGTLRRRCRLRQCKYLNNVMEPDHRVAKKRVWLAKGYQSFSTAWRTLQGIEAVHMIRKGRARWVSKGDPLAQLRFIDELFWADHLTTANSARGTAVAHTKIFATMPPVGNRLSSPHR